MGWYEFKPYVSVAERKQQAARRLAKLKKKKGRTIAPVTITGRKIAESFWGMSWCENLERYSDYATRLPRGRSYVRNGFVVDLQVAKGLVTAVVSGSDLYDVKVSINPVTAARWKSICRDCAGSIDSLVELLQGRMAKGVMDRVCRKGDGLFPAPGEIKLSCSCPDWAGMCKHIAAVLYGVGARLDQEPRLLFLLRGVDEADLLAHVDKDLPVAKAAPAGNILDGGDVAALFGLEMADGAAVDEAAPQRRKPVKRGPGKTSSAAAPAKKKRGRARPASGSAGR